VIKQLTESHVGGAAAWGSAISADGWTSAIAIFDNAVTQDRALARHVARDTALFFESFGGLFIHRADSLAAVGLDDSVALIDPLSEPDPPTRAAARALAVARTIQARNEGGAGKTADVELYTRLFEDSSEAGYELAREVAAWSGTVVARLRTSGRLPGDAIPVFAAGAEKFGRMTEAGWYPNPVNAGQIVGGEPELERWWNGSDWTPRLRIRDGRRWAEHSLTLLQAPKN
jgi:hypothetical protein